MDKETLIKIAEELHHGAFDANADYLILQQYRKNQREYAEEMKMSPAFYQTIHGALMKACFMEIAKLYDSSNGVVYIGTLLAKCAENQDLFPTYRETMTVSFASVQARKLNHYAASPLPTKPSGFAGSPRRASEKRTVGSPGRLHHAAQSVWTHNVRPARKTGCRGWG